MENNPTPETAPVAELPAMEIMDTVEAATYLRLSASQLHIWRHRKKGPPYVKLARRVRYRKADLDDWLAAMLVVPVAR